MAQRTHELPPGLQYDNVAPIEYFTELVARFEHDMQVFRQEIETTEKHIQSLSHPVALTPQGNKLHYYYIINMNLPCMFLILQPTVNVSCF